MSEILTEISGQGCRLSAGRSFAFQRGMRVRITREPSGVVDGVPLQQYHAGETYDLRMPLGAYLVAAGYACIEMRQGQRSHRRRPTDRRRHTSRG
jgi:hypothetical protein